MRQIPAAACVARFWAQPLNPEWLLWSSADARLAKAMPCQEIGFGGRKLRRFLDAVWGNFFGPASSAQLGLRFSLFDTSIYLWFCRGDGSLYMRCQQGHRGPDKPHDAHDAGLLGAAGALTICCKR